MGTEQSVTDDPGKNRCGLVAILGRPNVGKSTLLNRLIGQKLSITSRKPQTTRHRILGIRTEQDSQTIYVDTPGLHLNAKRAINRLMNRAADNTIHDVDVRLLVVTALQWTDEDDDVLSRLNRLPGPTVCAVNKVDRLKNKQTLLPYLETLSRRLPDDWALVPVSALKGHSVPRLQAEITSRLPRQPPLFPEDQVTDRSERFIAAERLREKLTRRLGEEVPYRISVEIENYTDDGKLVRIDALIWVERGSQKRIVVGEGGNMLKQVGAEARQELEALLNRRVYLRTWVKVKENWSDDERLLRGLGYDDR